MRLVDTDHVLAQPPSPAQTGAPLPLDQVDRPFDLAKFNADPCSPPTKDQIADAVADPPDGGAAVREPPRPYSAARRSNR
ncbi:hypothetical protein ACFVYA_37630 [Amycolatopsis sp. NPDC058278]|uniref:hypothetical protein n=1 Tax=Amycolatopsis sp. NPDC058278 TaxID=3346417 RepID=UPI0036DF2581